jgi:hypothetical protein
MPSAVLAVVSALLGGASVFGAPKLETQVVTQEETALGYAPNGPRGERQATFVTQLQPGVTFGLATHRALYELTLSPRIYYRNPNLQGLHRPLLLAQAAARHVYALDSRLKWATQAGAQYGEVEYSSAGLVLRSPASRPIEDAVLESLELDAASGFVWSATRRHEVSLTGIAAYTRPIGDETGGLFTTTTGGGDANQRFFLDRRATLTAPTAVRYYSVSAAPDWTTLAQSIGLDRRLARRTTFSVNAGGTALWRPRETPQVYPRGLLAIERVVRESRQSRLVNRIVVSADATFDPLLGLAYPVVGVEASLTATLGPRWTLNATSSAFTPMTRDPVTPEGTDTTVAISVAAGHRLTRNWSIEFGARESSRATHLGVAPFAFKEGETWIFARLTAVFGERAGEPQ